MKVLWVTNVPLPIISNDMKIEISYGGGWLVGLSEELIQRGHHLCVCFPIDVNQSSVKGCVQGIQYHSIPCNKHGIQNQTGIIEHFRKIFLEFQPDVIHIWGTEYTHSYFAMCASSEAGLAANTVVSIQGLVSIYADYYYASVPLRYILFPTIKEIIRRTGLYKERKQFQYRGIYEIKTLNMAQYAIGRTDWDAACLHAIAPSCKYLFCNETLRNSFYHNTWNIDKCERHSIFASQSQYPIKGFHKLLQAVSIVKEKYADVKVYITGKNRSSNSLKSKLSYSAYDLYIYKLIEKYNLQEHVTFLGALQEEEMCRQFLSANVFVSPSAIENSPNSVGEAMLLGVPVVSSDVGGVKNLMTHNIDGYIYPFEDIYQLAEYIKRIFENDEIACSLSKSARATAKRTHSKYDNCKQLERIYGLVGGKDESSIYI